jgi:hypothetical protein
MTSADAVALSNVGQPTFAANAASGAWYCNLPTYGCPPPRFTPGCLPLTPGCLLTDLGYQTPVIFFGNQAINEQPLVIPPFEAPQE